ncbi:MAG: class II fructose-bisphosphate aldolase [[Clostridium] innocuum]
MLVTTKELLCVANAENKAIGAFNITGLETLQAVLQAAESKKEPVILQFAQVHEEEHIMSLDLIGPIMVMMADQATIPVAVQLDHGVDLHILKKALDMGFTSVMYDGSSLPYGENIAYTRMAVSMAKEYGASVEAEIGQMAGVTLNDQKITENRKIDRSMLTDPLIAQDFVEKTGVGLKLGYARLARCMDCTRQSPVWIMSAGERAGCSHRCTNRYAREAVSVRQIMIS